MKRTAPPTVLALLARLLLPARGREFILGDLEEMYAARAERRGRAAAGRRYLRDVVVSAVTMRIGGLSHDPGHGPAHQWSDRASVRPSRSTAARPGAGLLADVRSALRSLRREKGFAALAILTLALGIGTTAAVFGMVDQLLLRPLPGVHADTAAYLRLDTPAGREKGLTTPEFDELRRRATLLAGIGSYFPGSTFIVSTDHVRGVSVMASSIYGDYFGVLGVEPAAGRLLRSADTGFGGDLMRAVISQRLASGLFGSAAGAVGKVIRLKGKAVAVIGVVGGGFAGCERNKTVDLWLPLGAGASLTGYPIERLEGRSGAPHYYFVVRPRAGVGLSAVKAQLTGIVRRLARAEPTYDHDARLTKAQPRIFPGIGIPPTLRARINSALRLLGGVVALVLLIACANVANVLLFRNVARRSAVATRRALGASPGRIAREHLAQSLTLGILGAAAGLGVGWLILFLFRGRSLGGMSAIQGLPLDHRVALFAVVASIVTAIAFGTLPAVLAGRFDLARFLGQSSPRHTGRGAKVRSALSAGQLALTLTLGVGAILLVRSLHNLETADTGLDYYGVVSMWQGYGLKLSRAQAVVLAQRVLAAVEGVPGVQSAAMGPPDLDTQYGGRGRVGPPNATPDQRIPARIVPVTPGWFGVFHVRALRGRVFSENGCSDEAPCDAVLTESLARKLFGTEHAVGQTLASMFGRPALHVIGVVPNLSGSQSPDVPKDVVFVTYSYPPVSTGTFSIVFRTQAFGAALPGGIRRAIGGLVPNEPVGEPVPISAAAAHREQETLSRLLVLLAALAATLAAVGLYGIIAFVVAGRRREFSIRLALGADASRIGTLVFRYGALIVGAGTFLGLGGAYALSRVLKSRLFGVGMLDPASYVGAAAFLALVAAAACWIPARRAMRVDPVTTLREE